MSSTKERWALELLQNKHFCDEKGMHYFNGREIKVDYVLVPFKRTDRDTSIKMSATALTCDTLEDSRQNKDSKLNSHGVTFLIFIQEVLG